MIYNEFQGEKLSRLGFGTMRLPTNADGSIDVKQVEEMVEYALKHGVNYFDTAYPYHGGNSERVIGEVLSHYDRKSFFLADKFPGHQVRESYNPKEIFEEQLQKCKVDYFDFYLLHNVYENSINTYKDDRWKIIDYFVEQKKLGRIKHLGFSCHGRLETLTDFLDYVGDKMEFCQIQLNYLDWTLQNGKEKYDLLLSRGIPVWVMEPVRGGRLARLNAGDEKVLKDLRPNESMPAWAFRFLHKLDGVKMILSGMSNMEQMIDNVNTFEEYKPLSDKEEQTLFAIAEGMKNSIPCTACKYCVQGCPKGLDIPMLIRTYNDIRFGVEGGLTASMQMEALPENKLPSACIGCGACAKICPQHIDVPTAMKEFTTALTKFPKWKDICKERDRLNELNKK